MAKASKVTIERKLLGLKERPNDLLVIANVPAGTLVTEPGLLHLAARYAELGRTLSEDEARAVLHKHTKWP